MQITNSNFLTVPDHVILMADLAVDGTEKVLVCLATERQMHQPASHHLDSGLLALNAKVKPSCWVIDGEGIIATRRLSGHDLRSVTSP
jgi:hypothetical protein